MWRTEQLEISGKKGRVPGSFPQTPGPQEEVKVRGSTVLANGFTTVTLSPGKGRSHIHDEANITRSGDVSKKCPYWGGIRGNTSCVANGSLGMVGDKTSCVREIIV
jgi:hypothetical protein